jgi:hypothetical protein
METKQMKILEESVFLSEIVLQIKIAQRAADRLPTISGPNDRIDAWSSIQLILVAAANVSKILWPHKKYEVRGAHLRKLLSIDDSNILFKRDIRNHFEHYDDRISAWFEKQSSAFYRDLKIGSSDSPFGDDPILTTNRHRGYDPLTQTITFRGESIDLAAVLNALEEILSKCSHFVLT